MNQTENEYTDEVRTRLLDALPAPLPLIMVTIAASISPCSVIGPAPGTSHHEGAASPAHKPEIKKVEAMTDGS